MDNTRRYRPIGEPEDFLPEYFCPAASWGDMTGLIPAGTDKDSELDSYEDVYPFMSGRA